MTSDKINELKNRFSVDGVTFEDGASGPLIRIATPACRAAVTLHGAHVVSYIPAGAQEVIFVSEKAVFAQGTPLRGGIPVCWPWFGDHPLDSGMYSHGFSRRVMWEVASVSRDGGDAVVVFSLSGQKDEFPAFPQPFVARFTARFGAALEVSLETDNTGSAPFSVSSALHTYFRIGDIDTVRVTGLDAVTYQDDTDAGKRGVQNGAIVFAGEFDRVYLDTQATCLIEDPLMKRQIAVEKSGSATTVVWNPGPDLAAKMKDMDDGEYKKMLCVEATNALEDSREVPPGVPHRLMQRISVTPL